MVRSDLNQLLSFLTLVGSVVAAGSEAAANTGVDRGLQLALKQDALSLVVQIGMGMADRRA